MSKGSGGLTSIPLPRAAILKGSQTESNRTSSTTQRICHTSCNLSVSNLLRNAYSFLSLTYSSVDIQSNFVEISIFLDAADLPRNKELLTLYTNSFHSLPLIDSDGTRVPYDEVVKLLDTETVDYAIAFGTALSEQLEISIKVERNKYKEAIVWLRKLLFASEFSSER